MAGNVMKLTKQLSVIFECPALLSDEGDQLTSDENKVLQSDKEFSDDSDGEFDSFQLSSPPEDVEMSVDNNINSHNTSSV
ncbi:hypothetical protein J6590_064735 [Homalodisca vitripennis]|nr:hypothetical protein J6590_064735 [Homalodisca vitripennis]